MSEDTYQATDLMLLGAEHVRRYQETDGEVGYLWNGVPTLLLTTTGRKSGEPRTTAAHLRPRRRRLPGRRLHGRGAEPSQLVPEPARRTPTAEIQVRAEHIQVTARTAADDEKPRLWKIVTEVWPNYDVYQSRTDRVIPVCRAAPSAEP